MLLVSDTSQIYFPNLYPPLLLTLLELTESSEPIPSTEETFGPTIILSCQSLFSVRSTALTDRPLSHALPRRILLRLVPAVLPTHTSRERGSRGQDIHMQEMENYRRMGHARYQGHNERGQGHNTGPRLGLGRRLVRRYGVLGIATSIICIAIMQDGSLLLRSC